MENSQTPPQKGLLVKVGVLALFVLAFVAGMFVPFGKTGGWLTPFYSITVRFPNANGLAKNAEVLLSGVKIGTVAEEPFLQPGVVDSVAVKLKIRRDIVLPKGSVFSINSSDPLGGTIVLVTLPKGFKQAAFDPKDPEQVIPHGAELQGRGEGVIRALNEFIRDITEDTPHDSD